jgi:hypothetical protein
MTLENAQNRTTIIAPPYHVQSTAAILRDGFPYFTHHESVSKLWSEKWRTPCAAGIYPFFDAKVEDFDPIFTELAKISSDDPGILHRPDDYAKPFLPLAQGLIADAEDAMSVADPKRARDLFLRAAAVYRIARFPINRSILGQEAWKKGKSCLREGRVVTRPALRSHRGSLHACRFVRRRSQLHNSGVPSPA